jgi:hypothetical protein
MINFCGAQDKYINDFEGVLKARNKDMFFISKIENSNKENLSK